MARTRKTPAADAPGDMMTWRVVCRHPDAGEHISDVQAGDEADAALAALAEAQMRRGGSEDGWETTSITVSPEGEDEA